jgi:Uma2 family endonuclease
MSSAKFEMIAEPKAHKWTREELLRMWAMGLLEGQRVELIEGEVIEMNPLSSLHATAVTLATGALREKFGKEWVVRVQNPLSLGIHSEPHPDIAVVAGNARDFRDEHPNTASLIVEVADSSLAYDRSCKAAIYAEGKIPEYWIVNLQERLLEVYRHPVPKIPSDKIRLRGMDSNKEIEGKNAPDNSVESCKPIVSRYEREVRAIYADILIFKENEYVSPMARPESRIAVGDLLP